MTEAQLDGYSAGLTWGHSCGCGQMVARTRTSNMASSALVGMTGKLGSTGMIGWLVLYFFM